MPGIFSDAAATNPTFATGDTAGLAGDRGHPASLPPAHAPANNLPLAGEVGQVASREESQDVRRILS
jgi:hypothetical protein